MLWETNEAVATGGIRRQRPQIFYAYKNLLQTYNKNINLSPENLFYHPNLITWLRSWDGAHISLCTVRRRLLEAGRKAKKPLKSSFPTQK